MSFIYFFKSENNDVTPNSISVSKKRTLKLCPSDLYLIYSDEYNDVLIFTMLYGDLLASKAHCKYVYIIVHITSLLLSTTSL